jgi:hypothetical protein
MARPSRGRVAIQVNYLPVGRRGPSNARSCLQLPDMQLSPERAAAYGDPRFSSEPPGAACVAASTSEVRADRRHRIFQTPIRAGVDAVEG